MVASKTSFIVAAVALGAASTAYAAPTSYNGEISLSRREAENDLMVREFDDEELYARDFYDELDARDFEEPAELEARDFDDDELYAREIYEDELEARDFDDYELYERALATPPSPNPIQSPVTTIRNPVTPIQNPVTPIQNLVDSTITRPGQYPSDKGHILAAGGALPGTTGNDATRLTSTSNSPNPVRVPGHVGGHNPPLTGNNKPLRQHPRHPHRPHRRPHSHRPHHPNVGASTNGKEQISTSPGMTNVHPELKLVSGDTTADRQIPTQPGATTKNSKLFSSGPQVPSSGSQFSTGTSGLPNSGNTGKTGSNEIPSRSPYLSSNGNPAPLSRRSFSELWERVVGGGRSTSVSTPEGKPQEVDADASGNGNVPPQLPGTSKSLNTQGTPEHFSGTNGPKREGKGHKGNHGYGTGVHRHRHRYPHRHPGGKIRTQVSRPGQTGNDVRVSGASTPSNSDSSKRVAAEEPEVPSGGKLSARDLGDSLGLDEEFYRRNFVDDYELEY